MVLVYVIRLSVVNRSQLGVEFLSLAQCPNYLEFYCCNQGEFQYSSITGVACMFLQVVIIGLHNCPKREDGMRSRRKMMSLSFTRYIHGQLRRSRT